MVSGYVHGDMYWSIRRTEAVEMHLLLSAGHGVILLLLLSVVVVAAAAAAQEAVVGKSRFVVAAATMKPLQLLQSISFRDCRGEGDSSSLDADSREECR